MSAFTWDSLLRVRVEDAPENLVELPQQQRRQHGKLPCDCITCYFTTATKTPSPHFKRSFSNHKPNPNHLDLLAVKCPEDLASDQTPKVQHYASGA